MSDRPYAGHTRSQLVALRDYPNTGAVQLRQIEAEIERRESGEREPETGPVPTPPRRMKFCLPLPPNPNQADRTRHWSGTYRQNQRYRAALDALLAYGTLPAPPATPHRRVRIRAKLYVWQRMDTVNAMARIKVAEDWLVATGYVVDDSEAHVEWAALPEQEVDRECPRLVLRVMKPKEDG